MSFVWAEVKERWLPWMTRIGLEGVTYHVAYYSDVGKKRIENQDVADVFTFQGGVLGVVCDGMGGYRGGEVASRLAADTIIQYFRNLPTYSLRSPFARLQEAVRWANRKIWEAAQANPEMNKMGTTVVAVLCYQGRAYIAHVGDSRVYLLRDGVLMRVTRDHSRVQRLVDEGKIKEEEAENYPGSNVISRVLGQYADVDVECQPQSIPLQKGDRILLCSDGLVRMVDEQDILLLLGEESSPEFICQQLVETANHAGGKDNVTVQVIDCQTQPRLLYWSGLLLYCLVLLFLFLLSSVGGDLPASMGASSLQSRVVAPRTIRTTPSRPVAVPPTRLKRAPVVGVAPSHTPSVPPAPEQMPTMPPRPTIPPLRRRARTRRRYRKRRRRRVRRRRRRRYRRRRRRRYRRRKRKRRRTRKRNKQ